ncbi:MAG: sugar phosphate isomerase/epimerase family protein [Solirubrobacteraceae bacterium]
MKYGANTWIWVSPLTDERLAELAPRLRDWGFDLVELPVEQLGDWTPERAAEVLAEHGLGASIAVAMAPGRELCGADGGTVATTQAFLQECLDVAATVGAGAIAGPLYTSTGRTWRISSDERVRLYGQLRESLAPLCEYGASRGVKIAIEPLVRYETSLINTVEQALEAIDGLPSCGLLVDTYHANVEERDVGEALRMAGDRLLHVHASANDRGVPGADHIDWPAVRDALAAIGYDGTVVIESFTAENETIATAASIWRPLAASQDAIAADGLPFLRDLLG